MKKKIFALLSIMVLLASFVPIMALAAVPNGTFDALAGKSMNISTAHNGTVASTTTAITDGDATTFQDLGFLNNPSTSNDTAVYNFSTPVYVDSFSVQASAKVNVIFIDASGTTIQSFTSVTANGTTTLVTNSNRYRVSKVYVENNSTTTNVSVFDLKVNALNAFEPGLLRGKQFIPTSTSGTTSTINFEKATDGFMGTYINPNGKDNTTTTNYLVTYTFPDVVGIQKFRILTNNTAVTVETLDDTGKIIETLTAKADGTPLTFANKATNVKKIRFYNPLSSGYLVTEVEAYALPPVPEAPAVTATAGNSNVTLNWNDVGATSYNIFQDGSLLTTTSNKTYQINGLTNGKTYSFQVSAVNSNGEGMKSASVSATPTLQPPTGFTAIPGNTTASLDWNDVGGATSYKIYQDGSLLTTTTTKPYLVKGLTNGTVYSYQVSAVNGSIESAKTAVVTAKPDNPAVPSGFTATPGNKEISLDWTLVPNATSYKIYKDGSFLTTVTTKPYLITSLTNGTVYSFEITAVNAIGESEKSAPVTASPIDFLAPTGLASNVSDSRVVLSWNSSPLATKYRLYRDGVFLSEIAGTSYSDSSVTNGTNYKYEVSAVNSSNESPKSAAIFAKPSKYIPNISTTTLPFTVVDMVKTTLNYLKLFPSWILLALAVIFVPALIFIVIWLVNRNKKENLKKQIGGTRENRENNRGFEKRQNPRLGKLRSGSDGTSKQGRYAGMTKEEWVKFSAEEKKRTDDYLKRTGISHKLDERDRAYKIEKHSADPRQIQRLEQRFERHNSKLRRR
jgi:hypothetical protein